MSLTGSLLFADSSMAMKINEEYSRYICLEGLTLFYMGFWRYVNTWGGDQNNPPLLKSIKMIQTWKKSMFWQKMIIFSHYLCILS